MIYTVAQKLSRLTFTPVNRDVKKGWNCIILYNLKY